MWWYFRTRDEADDFANDGWGADYGITNYSDGGPFNVETRHVSFDKYAKTRFTIKRNGNWTTQPRR